MAKELRFDVSALDQASKTFARMGQAVERFERRLDALDGKKVDATVDVDTRRADDKIGRFATDLRRKISAAVDNLPEVDITADSSDADRKLADIRRRMQELGDARIGVDLSADEAIRKANELQRELEDLSNNDPRIDVKANTDAAARSLREINREVDRIDGRTAVVHIRTDRSILDATSHITRLGAAMRRIALPAALLAGTPALVSLGGAAATASGALLLIPAAGNAAGLAVGTLVAAFQGFGDAIGDDPKKAAEAIAQLTPAARGAAQAINAMKPALSDIRKSVQETFFSGLGPRIGELGSKYLPVVGAAATRVAGQFNAAGDQVLQFLNHSHTVGQVRESFASLGTAIGNLTPTLMPLTSVLTDVGTVGAKVLADLTMGAGDAATGFADMVSRARESGQMEAAIRRGLNELQRFGQLAGNVGGILGAMYSAGKASGNDFLGTLINITGRMREFLSSAQGQAAMVSIFTGINQAVTALLPGLEAVGSAIGQIVTNKATSGALTAIATAFSDLLVAAAPVAVAISRVVTAGLQPFAAAIGAAAPLIGPLVGGLLAMKAASSALNFLTAATGLKTLGTAMATTARQIPAVARHLPQVATSAAAAGTAAAGAATGVVAVGTAAKTAAAGTSRIATALGRVQTVAGSVGRALPLVGLAFIAADTAMQSMTVSLGEAMDGYNQGGVAAEEMRRKVEEQTLAFGPNQNAVERAANSAADWVRSNLFGVATVDDYNAAIEEQNRLMHESVGATNISRSSFDQITSSMDRSKQASQEVTDSLALIGPALAGVKDGVAPTKEMDDALKGVAASAGDAAQQAGESAAKLGGVDAGAKAAANSMQASRDAFIQTATGAGMTQEAAGKLADQLGLIPKTAETNFKTNAATTALEVQQVADKLKDVPVGKSVTINAMTEPAKAALTGLGVTVKTLPDGRVEVTANTAQAQANMQAFINGTRDKRAEVTIDGQTAPAASSLERVLQLVAAGRGRINIDGNDQPARGVLSHLLGMVQGTNAMITVNGNAVPAEQVVNSLLAAIDSKSPTVDINGNKVPFDQVMASLAASTGAPVVKDIHGNAQPLLNANGTAVGVIQTPATKPIDGNATGGLSANELLNGAVQQGATKPIDGNNAGGMGANAGLEGAVQAPATKPIEGNNAGGMSQNQGLVGAVQAPATKPIDANDGGARGVVSSFVGWVSTIRAVVNIVANKIGFSEGGIVANAEGNIIPMARGGHASRPDRYAGRPLTPMGTRARVVQPNTWRVVGDRASGAEAYIPITNNARSKAILAETAGRMGYAVIPQTAIGMADGGVLGGGAYGDPRLWLQDFIRRTVTAQVARAAAPSITVQAGIDVAQLKAIHAQLVGLRADVLFSGNSPDVVTALNRVREILSTFRQPGVDAAALAGRSRAAFGMFGGGSAR